MQHNRMSVGECLLPVSFCSTTTTADPVLPAALCVIQTQANRFSGLQEDHALGGAAIDHGTHLIAGHQLGSFTSLLGKEQGFFALGHACVHDAAEHQVLAVIEQLEECDDVLSVEHIIVAVAVADLLGDQTGANFAAILRTRLMFNSCW